MHVMLGIPTYCVNRRTTPRPILLHEVIALMDVLSPWTVGRQHAGAG